MAGVLTFQQFIGGPDEIKVESIFPSTQKTLVYNFGTDVTDWTFTVDYQTLIIDTLAYDRYSGEPNFANSKIVGYFDKTVVDSGNIVVVDAATGVVNITIPSDMYTGAIIPDARRNVPLSVVGVTWSSGGSLPSVNTHRWVYIQNWEPGVTVGDPADEAGYTALGA